MIVKIHAVHAIVDMIYLIMNVEQKYQIALSMIMMAVQNVIPLMKSLIMNVS